MADITMCADGKFRCALADACYRVQAKAHPKYQSYSNFRAHWDAKQDECGDFWPMTMKPKGSTDSDAAALSREEK